MHAKVFPPCLPVRHLLFLIMLTGINIMPVAVAQAQAQVNNTLRFQLTLTDFYDPLLPPEQNQRLLDDLTTKDIAITGTYEPIRDSSKTIIRRVYRPNCMVGVTCFGGKWETEKTYQNSPAISVNYIPLQRKIVFELPAPIDTPFLAYRLNDISIFMPFASILIPHKGNNISASYVNDNIKSGLNLTNPDPDDRRPHVVLISRKGIIAYLSSQEQEGTQARDEMIFSEQERKEIFSQRRLLDYGGLFPISIPETLPNWYQINYATKSFYQTKGILINDQQIEAVILEGHVAYTQSEKTKEYYSKDEYWLRNKRQLTHIYLNPIHTPDYGCNFSYGITFFDDGTEARYIAKDLNHQEKFDERLMEKKKIHVKSDDLSELDIYKNEREQYYINQQKRYPSIENGLPACKRMITDAKRLLGTPKALLEQEFEQYKRIIEDADRERRKGF